MSLCDIEPVRFWLPPAPTETDILRFAMAERERARYRVVLELLADGLIGSLDHANAADLALRGLR
jgi:hypothetical protein